MQIVSEKVFFNVIQDVFVSVFVVVGGHSSLFASETTTDCYKIVIPYFFLNRFSFHIQRRGCICKQSYRIFAGYCTAASDMSVFIQVAAPVLAREH